MFVSRASNKRVERITKGHSLWHIVDKADTEIDAWEEDWTVSNEQSVEFKNAASSTNTGGLKDLGVDVNVGAVGFDAHGV